MNLLIWHQQQAKNPIYSNRIDGSFQHRGYVIKLYLAKAEQTLRVAQLLAPNHQQPLGPPEDYTNPSGLWDPIGINCLNLVLPNGENSSMHIFNRSGHSPFREHPEEFNLVVESFIKTKT